MDDLVCMFWIFCRGGSIVFALVAQGAGAARMRSNNPGGVVRTWGRKEPAAALSMAARAGLDPLLCGDDWIQATFGGTAGTDESLRLDRISILGTMDTRYRRKAGKP